MTVVVADTSPLNYLLRIGEILIPPEVLAELSDVDVPPEALKWIRVRPAWAQIAANPVTRLTTLLDLTAAQVASATSIFTAAQTTVATVSTNLQTAQTALQTAVQAASASGVSTAAAQIGTLTTQQVLANANADLAFYAILTSTQQPSTPRCNCPDWAVQAVARVAPAAVLVGRAARRSKKTPGRAILPGSTARPTISLLTHPEYLPVTLRQEPCNRWKQAVIRQEQPLCLHRTSPRETHLRPNTPPKI